MLSLFFSFINELMSPGTCLFGLNPLGPAVSVAPSPLGWTPTPHLPTAHPFQIVTLAARQELLIARAGVFSRRFPGCCMRVEGTRGLPGPMQGDGRPRGPVLHSRELWVSAKRSAG